jgi:hypothetical protein
VAVSAVDIYLGNKSLGIFLDNKFTVSHSFLVWLVFFSNVQMARPRIPKVYGVVQFIARLLSLGSIIAGLAILIRLSVKYEKSY